MKIVDVEKTIFQVCEFKDGINVIKKSFQNFRRV